ncbi:hypothetical protein ACFL6Y_10890 [Elusimicrobiota bacterium]
MMKRDGKALSPPPGLLSGQPCKHWHLYKYGSLSPLKGEEKNGVPLPLRGRDKKKGMTQEQGIRKVGFL